MLFLRHLIEANNFPLHFLFLVRPLHFVLRVGGELFVLNTPSYGLAPDVWLNESG